MTTPHDDRPPRRTDGGDGEKAVGEWYRMTGVGVEFIAAVLIGLGAGYLLDRWVGTAPWGLLIGGGLGFAAGLSLLVRAAKRMFRD